MASKWSSHRTTRAGLLYEYILWKVIQLWWSHPQRGQFVNCRSTTMSCLCEHGYWKSNSFPQYKALVSPNAATEILNSLQCCEVNLERLSHCLIYLCFVSLTRQLLYITQLLLQPVRHVLTKLQQQLRQRDVRLAIERLEQCFWLGVHRRVTPSFAPTQALQTTTSTIADVFRMSYLTVKTFLWIKPTKTNTSQQPHKITILYCWLQKPT